MANYSELLNDINAAIYENNDQEIDALEVRAILREMVTSLGSGFLFKGIATPSSPGTSQAPDQNVFYLATTSGTYTYLGGLVVAAGEVAFLCYDGTWTKKSSALLSTGTIVDNLTTDDATKPLSAKQGKALADAGAATAAEVTALGQEVDDLTADITAIKDGQSAIDYSTYNLIHAYLDNDGVEHAGTSGNYLKMDCTDYVPCKEGDEFTYYGLTAMSYSSVCAYDEDKDFVSVLVPGLNSQQTKVFTIPSGVSYIRAWSWNQLYTTPTTMSLVESAQESIILQYIRQYAVMKGDYKILDAGGNGDFTTISDAITGTALNGTILVMPGEYDMRGITFKKGQSFIGIDKEHCIFRNPQIYHDSPFVFNGYYKSISWICDAIDPADSYNAQNYVVHIDAVQKVAGVAFRVHFEDCYFFNGNGDCFGCGAAKDLEIVVDRCRIELDGWQENAACFALHNVANVTPGGEYDGAAIVKIHGSTLVSNRAALRFGSSQQQTTGVEWRSLFELVNNCFYSTLGSYGTDCIASGSVQNTQAASFSEISSFPNTFRLSGMSYGNNVEWLNA